MHAQVGPGPSRANTMTLEVCPSILFTLGQGEEGYFVDGSTEIMIGMERRRGIYGISWTSIRCNIIECGPFLNLRALYFTIELPDSLKTPAYLTTMMQSEIRTPPGLLPPTHTR